MDGLLWHWALYVVELLRSDRSTGLPVQRLVQPHQGLGGRLRTSVLLCPAQQWSKTHCHQGRQPMSTGRHTLPDLSQLLPQVTGRHYIPSWEILILSDYNLHTTTFHHVRMHKSESVRKPHLNVSLLINNIKHPPVMSLCRYDSSLYRCRSKAPSRVFVL